MDIIKLNLIDIPISKFTTCKPGVPPIIGLSDRILRTAA